MNPHRPKGIVMQQPKLILPDNFDLDAQFAAAQREIKKSNRIIITTIACCVGWAAGCTYVGMKWHRANR